MSDCIIQISRDNSFYGSGLTVGVALDGCDVGTLKNGEELRAVAAPGQHELSFYRYRRLDKTISFTIAEGQQNAFFTIKINASNRVDVVGGLKTKKQAKRPSGCLTALIVFLCLFVFIGGPLLPADRPPSRKRSEPQFLLRSSRRSNPIPGLKHLALGTRSF